MSDQPHANTPPSPAESNPAAVEPVVSAEDMAPPPAEAPKPSDVKLMRIPPRAKPADPEALPDPEERLNYRSPDQLDKARKRQAVFLQKRRKQKKRQVVMARIRGLVRAGYALVLMVGLYLLYTLPIWHITPQAVQIEGTSLLQARHLMPVITPELQKPMFRISPLALESKIEHQVPLVESIHIRRQLFPSRLWVSVTEKPHWGTLYNDISGKPQYWLHTDGTLTPVSQFYQAGKDPVPPQGEAVKVVGSLRQLTLKQRERLQNLVMVLTQSTHPIRLTMLDIRNPNDIVAQLNGPMARLGKSDDLLITRSSRLLDVVPALASRKETIAYIDLRWNNQILLKLKTPEQIKHDAEVKADQAKLAALAAKKAEEQKPSAQPQQPATAAGSITLPAKAVTHLAIPPEPPRQTQ